MTFRGRLSRSERHVRYWTERRVVLMAWIGQLVWEYVVTVTISKWPASDARTQLTAGRMNGEEVTVKHTMAGLSRTATDMATTRRGDGGQPGRERTGRPCRRAGMEPTRLKASLRAGNTRQGSAAGRRLIRPNTRRSQASHPTSQAAVRPALRLPTSRRSANSQPAARAGRLGGLQPVPAD